MGKNSQILGMDGVDLTFRKEALIAIATKAQGRETGARGLRNILEEIMLDVMYDLPSLQGVKKCVINKEVIDQNQAPKLTYLNRPKGLPASTFDHLEVVTWKDLRVFTLSREQFFGLTRSDYDVSDATNDEDIIGEVMETIDDVVWPFDDFGIAFKGFLPGVRITVHVSVDLAGKAALVTLLWWLSSLNIVMCSTVVPMEPYCQEDRRRSGLFMQINGAAGSQEAADFSRARFVQSQQPLLCVVNLCYALMSSDLSLQGIRSEMNRQQRRAAEREGRTDPETTYKIVLNRRNVTLRDVARDAVEGKRLKPGFPVRRHVVNAIERTRLGKLENVRSHQRGGKPGPGPGYLVNFINIETKTTAKHSEHNEPPPPVT
jgi:C-terminal, D2-small domain, of ClpB protein